MRVSIRSFLFAIWLFGSGIVCGLLFSPLILGGMKGVMLAIRLWGRVVLFGFRWLGGVRVEIRGRENLPNGPMLYAGKHQSTLDVIIPFLLVSAPSVIMKRELLWYPIFGWYALIGKMIPINRSAHAKAFRKMHTLAKQRVEEGRQILIFPEGTRRAPGVQPAYKPGVYGLYKALDTPLVPVVTNSGLCWHRGFAVRTGTVVYEILPPLPEGLDRKGLMTRLETAMETATGRLLKEGLARQGRTAFKTEEEMA